jgi:hypothetical protein
MPQLLQHDFPQSLAKVEWLAKQHLQIKDEPLLLALYFSPDRDPQDIFVFEVIENFGAGSVDPDQTLFEITYASGLTFPLAEGQKLHLVLTNPNELEVAFRDEWPSAKEIRDAVKRRDYRTIHEDPRAKGFLEHIRG